MSKLNKLIKNSDNADKIIQFLSGKNDRKKLYNEIIWNNISSLDEDKKDKLKKWSIAALKEIIADDAVVRKMKDLERAVAVKNKKENEKAQAGFALMYLYAAINEENWDKSFASKSLDLTKEKKKVEKKKVEKKKVEKKKVEKKKVEKKKVEKKKVEKKKVEKKKVEKKKVEKKKVEYPDVAYTTYKNLMWVVLNNNASSSEVFSLKERPSVDDSFRNVNYEAFELKLFVKSVWDYVVLRVDADWKLIGKNKKEYPNNVAKFVVWTDKYKITLKKGRTWVFDIS